MAPRQTDPRTKGGFRESLPMMSTRQDWALCETSDPDQSLESATNQSAQCECSSGSGSFCDFVKRQRGSQAAEFDKKAQWAAKTTARNSSRKTSISFGKLCDEMRALELHRFVRKPGSRKSFVSFAEYICDLVDGNVSKSTLYVSIELYQLTQGANALKVEDVLDMPVRNASILRKLKPEQRTPEIVALAKITSKRKFPAKVNAILARSYP